MNPLDEWLDDAADALGIERDAIERDLLLDLTREVAHGVARPAAPLTAYLLGLAAGKAGGRAQDVQECARVVRQALAAWEAAAASTSEGSTETASDTRDAPA